MFNPNLKILCPICETIFTPGRSTQRYCRDCRKNRKAEISKLLREEMKVKCKLIPRIGERPKTNLVCPICKIEFTPVNHTQRYCKDCRANRGKEIAKYLADERYKRKYKEEKRRIFGQKSIFDICKDIDEYNRKHGTHLSYGKYVGMMETGTLKID